MAESKLEPLFVPDEQSEDVLRGRRASMVCINGEAARYRKSGIYRMITGGTRRNLGVRALVTDVMPVEVRKLKKHGYAKDEVKGLAERHGLAPGQEVTLVRFRLLRS